MKNLDNTNIVGFIMEESDYSKFHKMSFNRGVDEKNVLKIVDSLNANGGILHEPVLVNGDYQIIDGQHRFEACKRIGIPVKYRVESSADKRTLISMNVTGKRWSNEDYLQAYANDNVPSYVRFRNLFNEFDAGITSIRGIISGRCTVTNNSYTYSRGKTSKRKGDGFNDGTFEFSEEQYNSTREILLKFDSLSNAFDRSWNSNFILTIVRLIQNSEFDLDRMFNQLNKYPNKVVSFNTRMECIEALDIPYNYNKRDKDKLNLRKFC